MVRKLSIYPKEMVPLQIDLAIDGRRYRFARAANPTCPLLCACEASRA